MGILTNLTERARLAINRISMFSEKEKRLISVAIDSAIESSKDYTDLQVASYPGIDDQSTSPRIKLTDDAVGSIQFKDTSGALITYLNEDTDTWIITGKNISSSGDYIYTAGSLYLGGKSVAQPNVGNRGQLWVDNDVTPQVLYFIDRYGNQFDVSNSGTSSPLTTKGDLYGFSTVNDRLVLGTNTHVLTADSTQPLGVKWAASPASGLADIVEDITPELGADLDVNGKSIVGAAITLATTAAGDITLTPDTTGDVILDGLSWPQTDGTANYVLKTDGAGQLGWVAQSSSGSSPSTGYGGISISDNSAATTIGGNSTDWSQKAQVVVFDTNDTSSSGVTSDHTNDHVLINNAGTYLIICGVSVVGTAADTISVALFKNNGDTILGDHSTVKVGTGGSVVFFGVSSVADLAANDTVELWVQNETATRDVTVQDAGLHVVGVTGLGNIVEDLTPQLGGNLDVNSKAIVSTAAGNIVITPDTTGYVILDGLKYPRADGSNGEFLKTNGSGVLSFDVPAFLSLSDTPGTFTADKWLKVNGGGTAIEWTTAPIASIAVVSPVVKTGTSAVTISMPQVGVANHGYMTYTQNNKLVSIESGADKTDAGNVATAGAIMQSMFSTQGGLYRISPGNFAARDIVAGNGITVDDGDGVADNPTINTDYTVSTSAPSAPSTEGHVWYRYV